MSCLLEVLFLLIFLTKINSLVLDVQAENGVDELATGDTAKYLLITTVTEPTELKFQIKLPFNSTSLFTVVHMAISSAGSNLVLQKPLPKFLLKAVHGDTGNSRGEWSLGQVTRSNSQISKPSDDNLIIRVTIQVQDHPLLSSDSVHWLHFALLYASDAQYLVQKPVTIRGGLNGLVSLNLEMNSSFEGVYAIGQILSFDIQVWHHHESTAASKDLNLFLYSQPYMKLLTLKERGALKYVDELKDTAGVVTMKISRLELYQTLSLSVSMSIGSFKNKDVNGKNITHSLIAELVYKRILVEQCQQKIENTYEVKTLDYQIQLQFVNKNKVVLEENPLITFLKPLIKCSSCGFRNCCNLSNVHINSSSYWLPFPVEDKLQFVEFDFYTFVLLKKISIRGSGNEGNAYVKTFKLLFSNDGIRWSTQIYRGKKQIYDGNVTPNDKVVQSIKPVTNARFVKIVPLSWNKRAALRVEFWSDQIAAFQMLGTKENRCIGSNGQDNGVYLVACDVNLQRWVWTDNEQLRHLKTGKCLHGHYAANSYSNAVSLEVCNTSLMAQKWYCYEDYVVASKTGNKSLSQLTNHAVRMSPLNGSNIDDKIVKIYSNNKSICSEKGMPALAKRQMLWNGKSDTLFVCDLNSRSEVTVSHCHFTEDKGETWKDLDLQLFNLLGVQVGPAQLYGLLFGQKTVLRLGHYYFAVVKRILKSQWETINNNSSSMYYPVNIPFIPFGDHAPDSEQPTDALTISSQGVPQWGASSAGIHSYVDNKWNLVLSWSKLGTRYARPGSCKQILEFGLSNGDGIYTIYPGHPLVGVKAYCDMTRHGGGWTLLVTSKTAGWTMSQLLSYATDMPSISTNHSILAVSNEIRDQTEEDCLQYRLEAKQFGLHGGIWRAPKSYSFLATNNSQVNVELVEKFGSWNYNDLGVAKRMPWICTTQRCPALLTTSKLSKNMFFGTIVSGISEKYNLVFIPAPWMTFESRSPGIIWYWIREGGCAYNATKGNI